MSIDEWIYSRVTASTAVNELIGTRCFPNYKSSTNVTPCVLYECVGFEKNRILRNTVYSFKSLAKSKSEMDNLNEALYSLFDTSTAWIRESSSSLYVDSVNIVDNGVESYDEYNKTYWKVLEVNIIYHK